MKKSNQLLILFAVLFCQTIFAQNRQADSSKWSFSVDISINHNFRTFMPGNIGQDSIDKPKMAYGFSVKPYYHISKKISVYSGISFSDKGYQTRKYVQSEDVYWGQPGPQGQNPPFYLETVALQQSFEYYYLSIPLGIDYRIGSGNFCVTVGAGLNLDICLSTNEKYTIFSGGLEDKTYDYNHIYPYNNPTLSGTLNSKFCFQVESKTMVFIQPFYTRSISSETTPNFTNANSKLYLYNYGVSLGVLF